MVCAPDVHDAAFVAAPVAAPQSQIPGQFIYACKDIIRNIRIQLEHRHPVFTSRIINFEYIMFNWDVVTCGGSCVPRNKTMIRVAYYLPYPVTEKLVVFQMLYVFKRLM